MNVTKRIRLKSTREFTNSEEIANYICDEFGNGNGESEILIPEIIRHNMIDAFTVNNGNSFLSIGNLTVIY